MTSGADADDLVTQLQRDNARLRAELEVARADIETLQNALTDVTPLHRHVSRDVKRRLRRVDTGVRGALEPPSRFEPAEVGGDGASVTSLLAAAQQGDRANVESYQRQRTSTPALRGYERISRALYNALRRLLATVKQKLR